MKRKVKVTLTVTSNLIVRHSNPIDAIEVGYDKCYALVDEELRKLDLKGFRLHPNVRVEFQEVHPNEDKGVGIHG